MADKLRSVNTKFWEDSWVETLDIKDKLLLLYLITNSKTNLVGIYEITKKRISFDTGLTIEDVDNGLKGFERVRKAYFVDNFIVLPNWLKNQNLNHNMKKGVVKICQELPQNVKEQIFGKQFKTVTKGFESIRNTLLKYEIEIEREYEIEKEIEYGNQDKPDKPKNELTEKIRLFEKLESHYRNITKKPLGNTDSAGNLFNNYNIDECKRMIEMVQSYYLTTSGDVKYIKSLKNYIVDEIWKEDLKPIKKEYDGKEIKNLVKHIDGSVLITFSDDTLRHVTNKERSAKIIKDYEG